MLARSSSRGTVGGIVVSEQVRLFSQGSRLALEDADEYELKGAPDRWHLCRVGD